MTRRGSFLWSLADSVEGDWVHLNKGLENNNSALHQNVIAVAGSSGVELYEIAVPENPDVVSGRKTFKTAGS